MEKVKHCFQEAIYYIYLGLKYIYEVGPFILLGAYFTFLWTWFGFWHLLTCIGIVIAALIVMGVIIVGIAFFNAWAEGYGKRRTK